MKLVYPLSDERTVTVKFNGGAPVVGDVDTLRAHLQLLECLMANADGNTPRCRVCGCTELNACVDAFGDGCFWTDATKTLCSQCVGETTPVPMLLFCPACNLQHVDAPEPTKGWTNPPHRTHLCHGCGHKWRPSDMATTGVRAIESGFIDAVTPRPHDVAPFNGVAPSQMVEVERAIRAYVGARGLTKGGMTEGQIVDAIMGSRLDVGPEYAGFLTAKVIAEGVVDKALDGVFFPRGERVDLEEDVMERLRAGIRDNPGHLWSEHVTAAGLDWEMGARYREWMRDHGDPRIWETLAGGWYVEGQQAVNVEAFVSGPTYATVPVGFHLGFFYIGGNLALGVVPDSPGVARPGDGSLGELGLLQPAGWPIVVGPASPEEVELISSRYIMGAPEVVIGGRLDGAGPGDVGAADGRRLGAGFNGPVPAPPSFTDDDIPF